MISSINTIIPPSFFTEQNSTNHQKLQMCVTKLQELLQEEIHCIVFYLFYFYWVIILQLKQNEGRKSNYCLKPNLRIFSFSRAAHMIVVYEQTERDESSTTLIHSKKNQKTCTMFLLSYRNTNQPICKYIHIGLFFKIPDRTQLSDY